MTYTSKPTENEFVYPATTKPPSAICITDRPTSVSEPPNVRAQSVLPEKSVLATYTSSAPAPDVAV
jgi:hypothetical protein